jgi:hypothetical protein
VLISLALIITLIVLVFARDVSRSAHGAITERRSENKSFAALANELIGQENAFDRRLDRLVTRGDTLQRAVFDARLSQLNDELPGWLTDASLLRSPALTHHVNETLYELTSARADGSECDPDQYECALEQRPFRSCEGAGSREARPHDLARRDVSGRPRAERTALVSVARVGAGNLHCGGTCLARAVALVTRRAAPAAGHDGGVRDLGP